MKGVIYQELINEQDDFIFFYYLTSGLLKIYFFLKIFKINKTKFVYGEYFILSKILYDNLSILKPTFFIYEIILKKFNCLIEKRIKKILIENNQIFSKNLLSHNFKKIKKKNPHICYQFVYQHI